MLQFHSFLLKFLYPVLSLFQFLQCQFFSIRSINCISFELDAPMVQFFELLG